MSRCDIVAHGRQYRRGLCLALHVPGCAVMETWRDLYPKHNQRELPTPLPKRVGHFPCCPPSHDKYQAASLQHKNGYQKSAICQTSLLVQDTNVRTESAHQNPRSGHVAPTDLPNLSRREAPLEAHPGWILKVKGARRPRSSPFSRFTYCSNSSSSSRRWTSSKRSTCHVSQITGSSATIRL